MNKFIIDTHILLWLIFDPEQIKSSKMEVLRDRDNDIFVATISFWEISLKYSLGKLELQGLKPKDIPQVTTEMGIEPIEIGQESMSTYYHLPKVKNHKDPFDRILIWHCIKNNFRLITQDTGFNEYREFGLKLEQ